LPFSCNTQYKAGSSWVLELMVEVIIFNILANLQNVGQP
jgi:hypothetical protein